MRSKKVWRYWCDHCGKGGCNKHAMELHEKHCTMNPNRFCRMCDSDAVQRPMDELIAAYGESLEALKARADGCPACMLAAIRQYKKKYPPDPEASWDGWDFTEAAAEYWRERNNEAYCRLVWKGEG